MTTKRVMAGLAVAIAALATTEARAQAVSTKVPLNLVLAIPCSGDVVQLSGTLHIVTHFSTSASGNTVAKVHFQPQKLQGVVVAGPNTGAKYTGTGVTQQTVTSSSNSFSVTFVNRFHFHGQGQAPNYKVSQTVHLTIANGQVTANVSNTKITCK